MELERNIRLTDSSEAIWNIFEEFYLILNIFYKLKYQNRIVWKENWFINLFWRFIENYSVILTTACANELFCFKEPSDNGPLFTELKFYQRAAKPEQSKKYSTHTFALLKWPLVLFCLSQD